MGRSAILGILLGALLLGSAIAADAPEVRTLKEGEASPTASIDDVSWLVGRWKGEGLGGSSEEVMAPPADGQIMGMFRQIDGDGALKFYEFYTITEVDGSLAMRIKHFSPALKGWEEKDAYAEFPLVAVEANAVYFDGLTYAMTGPDELSSAVNVEGQGVISFRFDRTALTQE